MNKHMLIISVRKTRISRIFDKVGKPFYMTEENTQETKNFAGSNIDYP